MRVVFLGTPEFAVPTLSELVARGHEVVAVYTRAPAAAGRGMAERKSPVHETADKFGIAVHHPKSLRGDEAAELFRSHAADVAVVVAYGLILPKAILEATAYGCLNLHASLLPRWRGAAPIHRAIMAGDKETGVMVMKMEEGLDTGPVGLAERVAISENVTTGELHDRLMLLGGDLMARALAALERGSLSFTPQAAEGVTYANKIAKSESKIDWSKPAREVHNHIRGLSPFPGAWFEAGIEGKPVRVKVLRSERTNGNGAPGTLIDDHLTVAAGDGAVRLIEVQRAGAKVMGAEEFLRGAKLAKGARFA
ncbi:MAG: methionyl-tRNA formyltransferase [Xanthobacteraceae bacterium]|nr:methionyl-tRNA formyltransferase [Xanthobacteraceae bacterium]MCW5673582.1 methionyl-tRNA formyltransferase [Xanthobacteraceae bacterium]